MIGKTGKVGHIRKKNNYFQNPYYLEGKLDKVYTFKLSEENLKKKDRCERQDYNSGYIIVSNEVKEEKILYPIIHYRSGQA